MMQPKLGILAGSGTLPLCIIEACQDSGRSFHVINFEGYETEIPYDIPKTTLRLGAARKILDALHTNSVEELILVGSILRPSLRQLRPDAWGIKFLAQSGAFGFGDNGLLTTLIRALAKEGFNIVGVADVAPHLLAGVGQLTSITPTKQDLIDINLATEAAKELGLKDIGQAAIARKNKVIGLEDVSGTDALIKNVKPVQDGRAGVLAKMAKPQQDTRIDLPTIGIKTIQNISSVKLAGVVLEANRSLILNQKKVVEAANRLNLFIFGV